MRSAKGSRLTRRSKAEATTGLAPKKASASTLWWRSRHQRVLICGVDFDFDPPYFFGGVSEERRPWINKTRRRRAPFARLSLWSVLLVASLRLRALGARTSRRLPDLRSCFQIEILVPTTRLARCHGGPSPGGF